MYRVKSEIDTAYEINEDKWVLTLARKAQGVHTQHAFFILEGIIDKDARSIWFMDLIGNPLMPNIKNARIRIKSYSASVDDESEGQKKLIHCCEDSKNMMSIKPGDEIVYKMWHINKRDAQRLISAIEKDQKKPPIFNIFGKNSIFAGSSAVASSKEKGHNCFTYAKAKIQELDIPSIKLNTNLVAYCMEHVADMTSLTLPQPQGSTLFWKLAVGVSLAAVAGLAAQKICNL